jgi:hypothetical protein
VADREGLLLLDLKDLKALLNHLKDNPDVARRRRGVDDHRFQSGAVAPPGDLEQQGAEALFGEPALQLEDILQPPAMVVDAFICWMPAVWCTKRRRSMRPSCCGCWRSCSSNCRSAATPTNPAGAVLRRGAFVVRRYAQGVAGPSGASGAADRSKGVGVYFVTQSPGDLPDDVLAQLGLRIQHGLRAFTAKEQKSLRAVADGFRPNPAFDALSVLTELGRRGAGGHA